MNTKKVRLRILETQVSFPNAKIKTVPKVGVRENKLGQGVQRSNIVTERHIKTSPDKERALRRNDFFPFSWGAVTAVRPPIRSSQAREGDEKKLPSGKCLTQ